MSVEIFLLLFSVATAVALAARRLRVPYTVALVLTGLTLGVSGAFHAPPLTHDLLFSVILPALVFEAAYHLDARELWHDRIAINAMATPGLVVGMLITAGLLVPLANALSFVSGFTYLHGVLFAAIVSATDPISVVALFRNLGAPARLRVIVEGESLLNDGTGIVVFSLAVAAVMGSGLTWSQAVLQFVWVAGGGVGVGLLVALGIGQVARRVDDAMIELTLTVIAAYGSFALAERLGLSGVIATVVAGLWIGSASRRAAMSPTTQTAVNVFWEYAAFALNSVVFLLLGMEVRMGSLLAAWLPIVVAYGAATLARAVMVYATAALLRTSRHPIPRSWLPVVTWSGLRGALSMVLALSLPNGVPHRQLLIDMTFGVVLLTILVQGSTMGALLRRLGLTEASN